MAEGIQLGHWTCRTGLMQHTRKLFGISEARGGDDRWNGRTRAFVARNLLLRCAQMIDMSAQLVFPCLHPKFRDNMTLREHEGVHKQGGESEKERERESKKGCGEVKTCSEPQ